MSFKISSLYWMFFTLGLSSASSLPTCFLSTAFVGRWIQPGLVDVITINRTWSSAKGTCLESAQDNHEDVHQTKFLFYNEQTRCKRCILFIPRHVNALQYRESECFDADDEDNGRICASITPDTVLYTLFRDDAQSISCPFEQSWIFEQTRSSISTCQPKAFHHCSIMDTFQLSFNNRCPTNRDTRATCLARFTDGNINYIVARSEDRSRFVCFSYTKSKRDEQGLVPNEIYLSADETCRDLLTRESAIVLNVRPGLSQSSHSTKIDLPEWIQGKWLTIGTNAMNSQTVEINTTQLIIKNNVDQTIVHDLKLTKMISNRRTNDHVIRLKGKSLEQCSSIFYCIKFTYRSPIVIDLSIGIDEHGCKDGHIHYTLFKPTFTSNISCPQTGVYKSLSSYRPSIPVSACSTGLWTLSIGCENRNRSELMFSSTCRHETVPDVQVITSTKGLCLASWRTDHRFQRTLVLYEHNRAFCLIQPLKPRTASWIVTDSSCTINGFTSISVENSLKYSDNCEYYQKTSSYLTSNISSIQRKSYLLFHIFIILFVSLCKYYA